MRTRPSGLSVILARGVIAFMTPSVARTCLAGATLSCSGMMAASIQLRGKPGFIKTTVFTFRSRRRDSNRRWVPLPAAIIRFGVPRVLSMAGATPSSARHKGMGASVASISLTLAPASTRSRLPNPFNWLRWPGLLSVSSQTTGAGEPVWERIQFASLLYRLGSSLEGRVLKRRCIQRYWSGCFRISFSMVLFTNVASAMSSPEGKFSSGGWK